jgi:hypothetical protein
MTAITSNSFQRPSIQCSRSLRSCTESTYVHQLALAVFMLRLFSLFVLVIRRLLIFLVGQYRLPFVTATPFELIPSHLLLQAAALYAQASDFNKTARFYYMKAEDAYFLANAQASSSFMLPHLSMLVLLSNIIWSPSLCTHIRTLCLVGSQLFCTPHFLALHRRAIVLHCAPFAAWFLTSFIAPLPCRYHPTSSFQLCRH